MIEKSGKLIINKKLYKNRYDKNEAFGMDLGSQSVKLWEIVKEIYLDEPKTILDKYKLAIEILKELKGSNNKLTLSKYMILKHQKDFMTLAFDPPEELDAK